MSSENGSGITNDGSKALARQTHGDAFVPICVPEFGTAINGDALFPASLLPAASKERH
jgi:hypothetical protein